MNFKQNLIIALIGIAGAIIVAFIGLIPGFQFDGENSPGDFDKEEAALIVATVEATANLVEFFAGTTISASTEVGPEDPRVTRETVNAGIEYQFANLYIWRSTSVEDQVFVRDRRSGS